MNATPCRLFWMGGLRGASDQTSQSDKESAADCRFVFKRVGHGDETYADVSLVKRLVSHKGAADTMSLTYIENNSTHVESFQPGFQVLSNGHESIQRTRFNGFKFNRRRPLVG